MALLSKLQTAPDENVNKIYAAQSIIIGLEGRKKRAATEKN